MVKLSVNINKIATLRNARGGNNPDVIRVACDCESFGADGITVHPRPDERHIRYSDVHQLKPILQTEFNIEGNPDERFIALIEQVRPHQVTLVPDAPDALTSNKGWDCKQHGSQLKDLIGRFKEMGVRTSIFLDPDPEQVFWAAETGTDRIELYTEAYAKVYTTNKEQAAEPYVKTAIKAAEAGLGLNAGHDLDLVNLAYFASVIPGLLEVSIGHALVCDALYYGLANTIQMYKQEIKKAGFSVV